MTTRSISPAHKQREERILQCAQTLLAEYGSLSIRIADIARNAEVSVGTFYSHFENKEDLIIALVTESTRLRHARFHQTFELTQLNEGQKLVVAMLRNFLFANNNLGLAAAEELSSIRQVWDEATEKQRSVAKSELSALSRTFRRQSEAAISAGYLGTGTNPVHQAKVFDKSAWFLMSGCMFVYRMQRNQGRHIYDANPLPATMLQATQAMLTGFGWAPSDPASEIAKMAEVALALEPGLH